MREAGGPRGPALHPTRRPVVSGRGGGDWRPPAPAAQPAAAQPGPSPDRPTTGRGLRDDPEDQIGGGPAFVPGSCRGVAERGHSR